jgi:hypothetical protein
MKKILIIAACVLMNCNIYAQKKDSVLVPCSGNINQFDPDRDTKSCYTYDTAHILPGPTKTYAAKKKKKHQPGCANPAP